MGVKKGGARVVGETLRMGTEITERKGGSGKVAANSGKKASRGLQKPTKKRKRKILEERKSSWGERTK